VFSSENEIIKALLITRII